MRRRCFHLFIVLLTMAGGVVLAESPRPVSPGGAADLALIDQQCPTFSWAGEAGSKAYELAVYEVEEDADGSLLLPEIGRGDPVVQVVVPGTASSWTPDRSQCLSGGSRYAWSIRSVGGAEERQWSDGQLFEITAPPAKSALHRVLRRIVDEMVETGELNASEAEALRALMNSTASLPFEMSQQDSEIARPVDDAVPEERMAMTGAGKTDDTANASLAPSIAVDFDAALGSDLELASGGNRTVLADASDAQITFYTTAGATAMFIDGVFGSTGGGWIDSYAADLDGSGMLHTARFDGQGFGSSGEILLRAQPTTGGTSRTTVELRATENADDGSSLRLFKMDGTEAINLDAEWGGAGGDSRIWTQELQITGGSDLSEHFEVDGVVEPEPGMVVEIAGDGLGLEISRQAYSRSVAGVISGAGGLKSGLYMGQEGTEADGQYPVALTGRVYVWADAAFGSIQPGDLLTSSDVPGHAMKVSDFERGQGTILGKAMTPLEEGRGLVLTLVSLQ